MKYACTNIINLIKRRDIIIAKLIKSAHYPYDESYLKIDKEGLCDDK